jgi:hypothetical protein
MRTFAGIHFVFSILLCAAAAQDESPSIIVNPSTNVKMRQAAVAKLLENSRYKRTTWKGAEENAKEPFYGGQSLSKFLRNKSSTGTNDLTLDELFTLKQVITGEEPEIVTYQVPISYDVLVTMCPPDATNVFQMGDLRLLMDSDPDEAYLNQAELDGCERATNGDCLLVWNTAFERPGQHAMQACFSTELALHHTLEVKGPVKPYFSSNLFRFFPSSSLFDDDGAFIDAQAIESNAVFSIEIKSRSGAQVKTLNGRTTNGVIHADWDLLDKRGRKFTGNHFDSYFHVKLPDSGRSQVMKQPQNKIGTSGD